MEETTQTSEAGTSTELGPGASAKERGLAALSKLGDVGDVVAGNEPSEAAPAEQPKGTPDPLAELAAKVAAKLKAKAAPQQAPGAPAWNTAAYKANPIAYLESLGLDVIEHADTLFEFANLSKEERQVRAERAELERLRETEKRRQSQEQAAREAREIETAESSYLEFLGKEKTRFPVLSSLDKEDQLRYSAEVAQLVVDAGEDADPARLAQLTELHVARLAKKLPAAGVRDTQQRAEAGGRTELSADGGAPSTITSQLVTESGSSAERDMSHAGRRAAAMRKAAALGW